MSTVGNRLVVATAGRMVNVFDVRSLDEPEQQRESSLKYQTRVVTCYPNGTGYAMSSVEGRVAIEYFNLEPHIQKNKYAFRCHRSKNPTDGTDIVYPVNALAYHPKYGTFATGGCDGVVLSWDGQHKKKLAQIQKYTTSISSLSFNHDGSQLAIAASYTYEQGEKDHANDAIYIHKVEDSEVVPKLVK
jgi:cell cycle arrest protein BUB3